MFTILTFKKTDAFQINDAKVSSTKIRNRIKLGRIELANEYLGRTFSFQGRVVTGQGKGKGLGFPTANIEIVSPYQITPGNGVYVVQVMLNSSMLNGMMNIGVKPTVEGNGVRTLEVHILDFNENLYGKIIEVLFIRKLRDEVKFASVNELIQQIKEDEVSCRDIFSNSDMV